MTCIAQRVDLARDRAVTVNLHDNGHMSLDLTSDLGRDFHHYSLDQPEARDIGLLLLRMSEKPWPKREMPDAG
jgi:hypothetical protein